MLRSSQPQQSFDSFELSIQSSSAAQIGNYHLVITSYLVPGPWSYKKYFIELSITNPCDIANFNFAQIHFGQINYILSAPQMTLSQPYRNILGVDWCDVEIM